MVARTPAEGRIKPGVQSIPAPAQHGGDGPAIAMALGLDPASILDLSQSMNPFAPSIASIAGRHLEELARYPSAIDAERLLAEAIGVAPERLRLTNGGSEAISLVADTIGGRVAAEPEFALHPRNENGPIWRSDPHNPTGQLANDDTQADIWDEAFYPLATGRWSAHRPGIVVGSLTKVFNCPGLRLGYVIADEVEQLTHRQPEWSVNALALAALPDLIESSDLAVWRRSIAAMRTDLTALFTRRGFPVEHHDAPWILVTAAGLRQKLAPHGIIVRDCASFGLPDIMRVGVPDAAGLARLEATLDRAMIVSAKLDNQPDPANGERTR